MSTIYVTTQGSLIKKEGEHLLVKKEGDTYHTIFPMKTDQIFLFGAIDITTPALQMLLRTGIDTVFLTKDGRFVGRLEGRYSKNIVLRRLQFKQLEEPDFRLKIAKTIVKGKLKNCLRVLQRINRTQQSKKIKKAITQITELIGKTETASTLETLRGYEGRGAAVYFGGYAKGFLHTHYFKKRIRRPPTDPVNSVLSLCYTLLMNRVCAAVEMVGLDPYFGALHAVDYGRMSLALDLMEEFRTIIVDTLTLALFNRRELQSKDFVIRKPDMQISPFDPEELKGDIGNITFEPDDELEDLPDQYLEDYYDENIVGVQNLYVEPMEKYPVLLKEDALKRVIKAFETKLLTRFYYDPLDRQITYAESLIEQARMYSKCIKGEIEWYKPLQLK